MHRDGHIGAALLFYSPLAFIAATLGGHSPAILGGILVVGVAMVPDLDMRVPFVPHRGPTHTLWFAAVTGAVGGLLGLLVGLQRGVLPTPGLSLFGALVTATTVCSHLFADALTPMGVTPFEPWCSTTYTWNLARASNPIANYALLGLGASIALIGTAAGVQLNAHLGL